MKIMNQIFISLVLFFSVFGSHCHQAPATGRNQDVYSYDYVLGVELNEPGDGTVSLNSTKGGDSEDDSAVGYKVVTGVEIRTVWKNGADAGVLLEIQLISPSLQIKSRKAPTPEGFHDHSSNLDQLQSYPFYAYFKNGQILNTFSVENDDISLVNIKKGLGNLIQFQNNEHDVHRANESNSLGNCGVSYMRINQRNWFKSFNGGDCQLPHSLLDQKYSSRSHKSPVFGSGIQSEISGNVKLMEGLNFVEEADMEETHVVRVNIKKEVGAVIKGKQKLKMKDPTSASSSSTPLLSAPTLDTAILEIDQIKNLKLVPDTLLIPHPEKIPFCETTPCRQEDSLLKVLTPENMATTKMANAFVQLVSKYRDAGTEEVTKLLNENIEIFPQLIDVFASIATLNTHTAVMSLLNFADPDDITLPERYLLGLSLTTSPAPAIVFDLYQHSQTQTNPNLKQSMILTIGALVHTIREQSSNPNFAKDIETHFTESLQKCFDERTSDDEDKNLNCAAVYLRAFKNLKSQQTVPFLFKILTTNPNPKITLLAMKALHSFPDSFFNQAQYRKDLLKIILQCGRVKYDSSSRTLAIDIILRSWPTEEEMKEIITVLVPHPNREHWEINTYLINRIFEYSDKNPRLQNILNEVMASNGYKNYHHLAPKGLSTAFARPFTTNLYSNGTFSNAIEMTGKLLKRSSFDVFVGTSPVDFVHLLELGIFAGGLGSFASSDNNQETTPHGEDLEADDDPTAGMELSLMGIQTRPIVFFTGKGELMGLVWSGAGSERTTALQGNVLLQNELKRIPLFNGLVADVEVNGGLSFDLSGSVQISLWHRTANSLVENKAGLVLTSVIRVDTSFVHSRVDYTVGAEAGLDFTSDINFYDGVLMCLKLTQNGFNIKQNIHKTERIPGSRHRLRKAKYKSVPVPGLTYALNKKNSEQCGKMYDNRDEL